MDFSSAENIITSVKNVVVNTAESVDTSSKNIVSALQALPSDIADRMMPTGLAVEPSTQGSTDLSVKIDGQTEAENNRLLTYTITVTNEGPSEANGANMRILLPA